MTNPGLPTNVDLSCFFLSIFFCLLSCVLFFIMTGSGESGTSNPKRDPVDLDDPLYVHLSSNAITSVINFKLLGIEIFRIW